MGGLLKEVLKSICGMIQWSYAVFWKTGCQNTKLLIWEECYYEPAPSYGEQDGCWGSEIPSQLLDRMWDDKVHLLINKMMINNHINVVGQGLVGRAAFTGNHQWILATNYFADAHPPEVLNEVHLQISAGMQTVAVIPVLPHGVLQLGSSITIMENMGFLNNVKSLILGLGCIPGALLSNSYGTNESIEKTAIPISLENPVPMDSAGICRPTNSMTSVTEGCSQQSNSSQAYMVMQENSQGTTSTFRLPALTHSLARSHGDHRASKLIPEMKPSLNFKSQMESGVVGAEVIHSNSALWPNPQFSFGNSQSMEQHVLSDALQNHVPSSCMPSAGSGVQKVGSSTMEGPLSILTDQVASTRMLSGVPNQGRDRENFRCIPMKESMENDLFEALSIPLLHADDGMIFTEQLPSVFHDCLMREAESSSTKSVQLPSGDDLVDVLGADLKGKLLNGKWNNVHAEGQDLKMQNMGKAASIYSDMQDLFSDMFTANERISDRGIYSGVCKGDLLDAVVSSNHSASTQILDDNVSCGTTLTKLSNSPIPSSSATFGQVNISNQVQGKLIGGISKSLLKGGTLPSSSFRSSCSKDDVGTSSQTTSMYGSQISSWVEQGRNSRCDTSVATENSKRNNETTKANRKRQKTGENPRPRPKDRQMIQDRVKELREIVPNGAKCSIDALLEKTIKHMLFLQSVTKQADELKQTGESKIKENFEGGATWAFEVGSQSMLSPIVVEDLNRPRQMLIQMLCEERGFFLEIADLIRGLGLTILKGVMETQNDKIWARFTVEANRDVTRVEIFMSLVRLLDQTMKGNTTSSSNAFDSSKIVVQHSASIPATGRASSLR